jgi:hypothetical protein
MMSDALTRQTEAKAKTTRGTENTFGQNPADSKNKAKTDTQTYTTFALLTVI